MKAHPKTQRAWASINAYGEVVAIGGKKTARYCYAAIVLSEAAVTKCRHADFRGGHGAPLLCRDCGSYKLMAGNWQRPRILRASRVK